jgi:hypothetical protein
MPILLAGTIEFVHIEQISALFKFRLIQVLLYIYFEEYWDYQVKEGGMGRHVYMEGMGNTLKIVFKRPEEKR